MYLTLPLTSGQWITGQPGAWRVVHSARQAAFFALCGHRGEHDGWRELISELLKVGKRGDERAGGSVVFFGKAVLNMVQVGYG